MDESGIAANVARAIATALDWTSTPDARAAAHSYLESIKAGDTHVLANTSFLLVKRDWSSEIRLHAFKMLQLLERHYGAAIMEASRQQMDIAKQHGAAVVAAVNAVNAYAEWAPLPDLAKYGIIYGCGFLLTSPDFRVHACEFFKLVSPRKRPVDASSDFDSAMRSVFEVLMNVTKDFFMKSSSGGSSESEFEFAEYICESLVSLGSTNLQCIAADSTVLSFYLQQMLGFFQHSKLALHYQSLLFWLSLMRDLMSKSKTALTDGLNTGMGQADNEKRKMLALVTDDVCCAILDTSFQRMLMKEKVHPGTAPAVGTLELWSDDFDSKVDFSQYRSRLLELIRFIAFHKPLVAAAKVSERITEVIKSFMLVLLPTKLLRAIHALWSPSVTQALPGEMRAAMLMSDVEKASLLGEGKTKLPKGALTFHDGSQFDISREAYSEPNEADIRNWLRGIRDSGYSILGLSATLGDSFFRCVDPHSVILALMENVQHMEFRHIKQLVHLALVPLVKFCPSDLWDAWLEKLLHPLFLHVWQALTSSWSSLLREGKAKVPDLHGVLAGSDLKVEVMEEKLLRDLTREICSLCSVLAAPGLNAAVPSLEQAGQVSQMDDSSMRDLAAFASTSMVGEAMSKVTSLCGLVILLAISTDNAELREFVCKDLFSAIIQGLTLESNSIISAELVGLCREIFIYLSNRNPSPRQILLSLPCITLQDLLAFEEALSKTGSPKEQKQHMKSLLIMATGNKLKALATQKAVNVITNVTIQWLRNSDKEADLFFIGANP
ncbi:UNVERIFIED_CONTAM: protein HASTY 1 [Sesamum angustifolium]|uniref:Protein HASTY 1 n=1 Tax=Sesamum angustifolium TaxID=2727405 RepID=A0AAW2RJ20_9LAMI